jgi:hypothetical protein
MEGWESVLIVTSVKPCLYPMINSYLYFPVHSKFRRARAKILGRAFIVALSLGTLFEALAKNERRVSIRVKIQS